MENKLPFISIIIPCFNEKKYIADCLNSVAVQTYPKDHLEILVVDGMSSDGTREIIQSFCERHSYIKMLNNLDKYVSFAFNIGIKNSRGELVILLGSHAAYEKNYISKCAKYLFEYKADNVGGVLKIMPQNNGIIANSIALSLSSYFGAGNAYFRMSLDKPRDVDTVFGGCYRKEVFDRIGLFNEKLLRSQDIEFNMRLKKAGGKIVLVPDIVLYYHPKSNLKDFAVHNFMDGVWAIYPAKFIKMPLKLRHYMPLFFISFLLITLFLGIYSPVFRYLFLLTVGLYFLALIYFSIKIVFKEKDPRYLFIMPIVFAIRHVGYGLGSLWGLIKLLK